MNSDAQSFSAMGKEGDRDLEIHGWSDKRKRVIRRLGFVILVNYRASGKMRDAV